MGSNLLLSHLPPYLQGYQELAQLLSALQGEVDDLWVYKAQILDNAFVSDADEYGVGRYEAIAGLTPTPSETLEERKFNLLVKINEQLPYSLYALKEKLSNLCGEDGYFVTLSHQSYTLDIRLALAQASNFTAVEEMVNRVVPCNLICTVTMLYNQHSQYTQYTHSQLSSYTHSSLKSEVLDGN